MKYPAGCPVWYHMDTHESDQSDLHVSVGVVRGVSMDLASRQLVYEIAPCQYQRSVPLQHSSRKRSWHLPLSALCQLRTQILGKSLLP